MKRQAYEKKYCILENKYIKEFNFFPIEDREIGISQLWETKQRIKIYDNIWFSQDNIIFSPLRKKNLLRFGLKFQSCKKQGHTSLWERTSAVLMCHHWPDVARMIS